MNKKKIIIPIVSILGIGFIVYAAIDMRNFSQARKGAMWVKQEEYATENVDYLAKFNDKFNSIKSTSENTVLVFYQPES